MANPTATRSARRPLHEAALTHIARRLHAAASPPWLHTEVARRMADRLPIVKLKPACVVDWGAFVGGGGELLNRAYPAAQVWAVEADARPGSAAPTASRVPWWSPRRWTGPARHVVLPQDVPAGQGQLLWANMHLQGVADPQAVMAAWQRALAVDGFLMFSTLGPGSLLMLRDVYAEAGWPAPFAPFVDMHDLGDMLVEAGFADPVMDQETITLTWASAPALLAELRALGGNASLDRLAGLRTPRWRGRLEALLGARADAAGRVALGFEVVYGHAFKAAPRPPLAAQTEVPLHDMQAMLRGARRRV